MENKEKLFKDVLEFLRSEEKKYYASYSEDELEALALHYTNIFKKKGIPITVDEDDGVLTFIKWDEESGTGWTVSRREALEELNN